MIMEADVGSVMLRLMIMTTPLPPTGPMVRAYVESADSDAQIDIS